MGLHSRSPTQRAGTSAIWAITQSVGKQGIDLLVFLCLARWVAPEAFGLVAMVGAVIVIVVALAELGLGDALVQRATLEAEDADTAFWMAVTLALVLILMIWFAAPFIAQSYGRADLTPVLRALSPLFAAHALNIVPQAQLQRAMSFRPLATRALAGSLLGGVTGIALAYQGASVWSLVGQQLVAAGVSLAMLWRLCPWRPGLRVSRRKARELIAFGVHVCGARFLNVLSSKADDVAIGWVLGPLALGFYSVACRLQLAMEQVSCQGIDVAALSTFSRALRNEGSMRDPFRDGTAVAAMLAFPTFGAAVLFAPELVHLAVGETWMPSVPALQVLTIAALLQALMHFNHAVFKALGRPSYSTRLAIASTVLTFIGLAIAVQFGIVAVAIAYLVRTALLAPVGLVHACRLVGLPVRDYLRAWVRPIIGTMLAIAFCALVQRGFPAIAGPAALPLARVAILGFAFAVVYGLWIGLLTTRDRFARSANSPSARAVRG